MIFTETRVLKTHFYAIQKLRFLTKVNYGID